MYTASDVINASADNDPVMIDFCTARKWIEQHGLTINEFIDDHPTLDATREFDGALVFNWLGY